LLPPEGLEAKVGHDVGCSKMLELRAVGAGLLRQGHEVLGTIQVTVVIGSDIRDEVGGLIRPDEPITDQEVSH